MELVLGLRRMVVRKLRLECFTLLDKLGSFPGGGVRQLLIEGGQSCFMVDDSFGSASGTFPDGLEQPFPDVVGVDADFITEDSFSDS